MKLLLNGVNPYEAHVPQKKSTSLDDLFLLCDVNNSPILTHAVVLLVSAASP